ncbi:sensor histidine kinase [Paenibacillus sp. CAU 1782]
MGKHRGGLILIPVCFLVLRTMVLRPLNRILTVMRRVGEGNLNTRIDSFPTSNEFRVVNETFNHMIGQVQELRIHVRNHELIQEMSMSLVQYFRYMFRSNLTLVPLKDEIKHIRNYMRIQEMRFPGKLSFALTMPDYLQDTGFRTVEDTAEQGLLLNGKPIKLNGVCRHQEFGGIGNAILKDHMEQDMSLIREIGANSVRLAHYQHDDYFYTLCDRHGLLVWAEIPFISISSTIDPENRNAMEQLGFLIKQAYNHTSIYCWGVQNEITTQKRSN